jgi:hypothetical protein
MRNTDRRKVLQMLAAAAVIPALASREVAAAESMSLIAPPQGMMQFQRLVVRGLAGGAKISVTRGFAIEFRRSADGFIVDGKQVSVEVSAPASLSAFADLEQARVETGMFPIMLDPFGQIISGELSSSQGSEIQDAFDVALQQIATQPLASGEHAELRQFIAALHQAGAMLTVAMPFDLFAPAESERLENRTVSLPTGDIGLVTSRFGSERDIRTGLMRRASREVMTEVEGDRRQTTEHWQLTQN